MDLAIALLALVISVIALGATLRRGRAGTALPAEVAALRRQLDETQRELSELKAAAEVVPVPPLPRARSAGGLDDLRQQLREAHREGEDATEG